MSSEPQHRPLTDEELRELPKVVAKIRKALSLTQVLALILGCLTLVSGTVAIMESTLVNYEHKQIDRIDKVDAAITDRVTSLEKQTERNAGGWEARLKGVEDQLVRMGDLLQRHMGIGK